MQRSDPCRVSSLHPNSWPYVVKMKKKTIFYVLIAFDVFCHLYPSPLVTGFSLLSNNFAKVTRSYLISLSKRSEMDGSGVVFVSAFTPAEGKTIRRRHIHCL